MKSLPANVYVVILAGGSGTRFWPKSRHLLPKQLCKIGDSHLTMIEITLARLEGLVPPERRLIVTHKAQEEKTRAIVGSRCHHILAEPLAKNTAPALALASLEVESLSQGHPEAIMISLHADALIGDLTAFQNALHTLVALASKNSLALLGMKPDYPETGYGYIERGLKLEGFSEAYQVASFREKPDRELAQSYLSSGRFLWNSGIFAWRVSTILQEFEAYTPDTLHALQKLLQDEHVSSFQKAPTEALAKTYAKLEAKAIDPAILERSQRVTVLEAKIEWKDVGSWDALEECFPVNDQGNLFYGEVISIDSHGITVDSDAKVVACIGLKDLVIVSSGGCILVCEKERAQDVRLVVEALKAGGKVDLI